jgi:hypothetical protein
MSVGMFDTEKLQQMQEKKGKLAGTDQLRNFQLT